MNKFLLLALIISTPVCANNLEDETLLRAVDAINEVQAILIEAKGHERINSREIFHYDWVNNDLIKVKEGIYQKIRRTYTQPKIIEPVVGDYIE